MDKLSVSELADLCDGRLLKGDPAGKVGGLSSDSRTVKAGQLFLALKGDRFDGHDFAEDALKRGAAGIIGRHEELRALAERVNRHTSLIGVDDPLTALQALARRYRSRFAIPLVAITGSCGKTTTKDMLAAILGRTRRTVSTVGNLNNLIGAPLMLLRMDADTEAAIIEIASNAPGEIGRLAEIVSPTAGIITNIAPVHLEGFGTIDGVFREKCSLLPHIRPGGFLVAHGEDVPPERIRSLFHGKLVTFGLRESADYFASDINQDIRAGTEFLLNARDLFRIPLAGVHNVQNALAAIAASVELGVDMETVREALEGFSASGMRMQVHEFRGVVIINDAYNANPRAMRESISTVMSGPAERRILVLGDMLELGGRSETEHRMLGQYIGQAKPDLLYLTGRFAADVKEGAVEAGMEAERISCCADAEEIAGALRYVLQPGDVLLVKGSRGMKMERTVQLLLG